MPARTVLWGCSPADDTSLHDRNHFKGFLPLESFQGSGRELPKPKGPSWRELVATIEAVYVEIRGEHLPGSPRKELEFAPNATFLLRARFQSERHLAAARIAMDLPSIEKDGPAFGQAVQSGSAHRSCPRGSHERAITFQGCCDQSPRFVTVKGVQFSL